MNSNQNNVNLNKTIAYKGKIGREREIFCADFVTKKHRSLLRIGNEILKQIENNNEKVTCRKGCAACCVLYIEASIQESEAIVYFLYHNPGRLYKFLDRYDLWRHQMRKLGDPFNRCEQILHEQRQEELSFIDRQMLLDSLKLYHQQNIPCPFLNNAECTIYEVRPYVCANHLVTTPSEWCQTVNWCDPTFPDRPMIYMTGIDEIYDLSFYHTNLEKSEIGFVPTTVFKILTNGLNYIAETTGIAGLIENNNGDSEVVL